MKVARREIFHVAHCICSNAQYFYSASRTWTSLCQDRTYAIEWTRYATSSESALSTSGACSICAASCCQTAQRHTLSHFMNVLFNTQSKPSRSLYTMRNATFACTLDMQAAPRLHRSDHKRTKHYLTGFCCKFAP